MGNQFKFWWRCVQHAWRGCWSRANELAAVIGGGLLTGLLWIFSPYLDARGWIEAPTSYLGVTALATATAIASIAVTFILIFLIRLPLVLDKPGSNPGYIPGTERDVSGSGLFEQLDGHLIQEPAEKAFAAAAGAH
jgi:hypothetical protein